jgi:hypothetical protein
LTLSACKKIHINQVHLCNKLRFFLWGGKTRCALIATPYVDNVNRRQRKGIRRTPPSSPTPSFSSSPLPSLLPTTHISVTNALSTLALFVTAIVIRRTLLSFVVTHRRGRVVASPALSCQPPPAFVDPIAG